MSDMEKAKRIGVENYRAGLVKKKALLDRLLSGYDGGRKDVFFCLVSNLMEPDNLSNLLEESNRRCRSQDGVTDFLQTKHSLSPPQFNIQLIILV